MKKKASSSSVRRSRLGDRDTLRPEYDFSKGVRGVTAERFKKGANVVVIDPDLRDVFPDSESVNEALRVLATAVRRKRRGRSSA